MFAKTGTLTGVSTLSGYLTATNFPDLVFSIMVCNSDQPTSTAQKAIDAVVLELYNLDLCGTRTR